MAAAPPRPKTIPIGWIGGECAQTVERYQLAFTSQSRGRVVSLFADCREVADRVAGPCGGTLHRSLRSFCQHPELGAILCLEAGWFGTWGLNRMAELAIPILVIHPLSSPFSEEVVDRLASEERDGCPLVPAAVWRMTPATLRLRELLATQLGPIRRIEVIVGLPFGHSTALIEAIDWCRTLLVSSGGDLHGLGHTHSHAEGAYFLNFRGTSRSPLTTEMEVTIRSSDTKAEADESRPLPGFEARIETERGTVTLQGASHLHWTKGGTTTEETLDSDRSAEQVMLDLFLRRVVGGLVPAPSWGELHHVLTLWKQARLPE